VEIGGGGTHGESGFEATCREGFSGPKGRCCRTSLGVADKTGETPMKDAVKRKARVKWKAVVQIGRISATAARLPNTRGGARRSKELKRDPYLLGNTLHQGGETLEPGRAKSKNGNMTVPGDSVSGGGGGDWRGRTTEKTSKIALKKGCADCALQAGKSSKQSNDVGRPMS